MDIENIETVKNLGLYIHIPFCKTKCSYCDFYSIPGASGDTVKRVLDETSEELAYFLDNFESHAIDTIYIGGGTPGSISRSLLSLFLDRISSRIRDKTRESTPEWTIEANPQSIDEEFCEVCATHGINRMSVGVQSLVPGELKAIGRSASSAEISAAMELLQSKWNRDLNVDLLSGLPGQTIDSVKENIRICTETLNPSHVSFYSLTAENGTELQRRINAGECNLPDSEEQEDLWLTGCASLEESGLINYEISNFAKPGSECLHNLKYWRMEPYLGIGPGAVSTLPDSGGGVTRFENPKDIHGFLAGKNSFWSIATERIPAREFIFENIMMGLRLESGIQKETFVSRFGIDLEEILGPLWKKWSLESRFKSKAGSYALKREYRFLLDPMLRQIKAHFNSLPDYAFPEEISWP